MTIKLCLSLALLGCLGSCVVIDERYTNYHIYTTENKHIEHSVSTAPTPAVQQSPSKIEISLPTPPPAVETPPTSSGRIRCDPFVSPTRERLPSVPDFESSEVELELQIANYINSLYASVHKERQALDEAVAKHLESCGE